MKKEEIVTKEFELTKEDFLFLCAYLLSLGFTKVKKWQKAKAAERTGSVPPKRKYFDAKVTFVYSANGYTTVVHIAYSEKYDRWFPKSIGYGWVLIRKGDVAKYFAKPFQKNVNMIPKMLRYAELRKEKIDNMPLCQEELKDGKKCLAMMDIGRREDRRGYYHVCRRKNQHKTGLYKFTDWDVEVSDEDKAYLKIRRMYTTYRRKRNKKLGLDPTPIMKIRKKTLIGRPENLQR